MAPHGPYCAKERERQGGANHPGIVKISLNGTERAVGALTLRQLLDELDAPAAGIAVAQNDEVVRREVLDDARINDGDRIEIIKAVAGG